MGRGTGHALAGGSSANTGEGSGPEKDSDAGRGGWMEKMGEERGSGDGRGVGGREWRRWQAQLGAEGESSVSSR